MTISVCEYLNIRNHVDQVWPQRRALKQDRKHDTTYSGTDSSLIWQYNLLLQPQNDERAAVLTLLMKIVEYLMIYCSISDFSSSSVNVFLSEND